MAFFPLRYERTTRPPTHHLPPPPSQWPATWDLAFHVLPIAMVDPEWAKRQLVLLMREWYMAPNGALPAYE